MLGLVVGACGWGCAGSNSTASPTTPVASASAPTLAPSASEAPAVSTPPVTESAPQPTASSVPPGPPPQVDEKTVGGKAPSAALPSSSTGVAPANPTLEAELQAGATGPAVGGPRGSRACQFHESVDAYQRRCTISKAPDGSLIVVAKGTPLNPEHGFEFSLHGGPSSFVAKGTLNAFGICRGPFIARANAFLDRGRTKYELRFNEHCKITID